MGLTSCPSCIQGHTTKTHTPGQGHSRCPCGPQDHPDPASPLWPLPGGRELCSLFWRDRPGGQGPHAVQPRFLIKLTRFRLSLWSRVWRVMREGVAAGSRPALAAAAGSQDVTSRHVCGDTDRLGRQGARAPLCLPLPTQPRSGGPSWAGGGNPGSWGPAGKRGTDVGTRLPLHTPGGWFSHPKPSSSALAHAVGEDIPPAL